MNKSSEIGLTEVLINLRRVNTDLIKALDERIDTGKLSWSVWLFKSVHDFRHDACVELEGLFLAVRLIVLHWVEVEDFHVVLDKLLVDLVLITNMLLKGCLKAFGTDLGEVKYFISWNFFNLNETTDVSDHFVKIVSRFDSILLQDWKSLLSCVCLLFVKEHLDAVLNNVDQDQEVLLHENAFWSTESV